MKITEILRLREMGLSYKEIAKGAGIGKSTVGDVLQLCKEHDLDYSTARRMANEEIQLLLYPDYCNRKGQKPEPNYQAIQKDLARNRHTNMRFIWEETYHKQYPDGLGYSQFCERYRRWSRQDAKRNVTMHMEREAGREMFVDWMGETPLCVVDSDTGELHPAHFFLSVLGASGYPYVEAFPDESQTSWIGAHVRALEYYGGAPKILVPDNCKTAVKSPKYYDPEFNPAYREFAEHYNIAVLPARVRAPRDKSIVEQSVGWLETWLVGMIRDRHFFGFVELNQYIDERLAKLVCRPFQKREGNRYSIFCEEDKPALRPLPSDAFEIADMIVRRVPDNYHVEYKGFYYSVPYTLFKQQVTLRASERVIEIFDKDRHRVATHLRRNQGRKYVTDTQHMPENHKAFRKQQMFDGERYRRWAGKVGVNTQSLISALIESFSFEEQAYRSCMGILRLSEKYGQDRIEHACEKAMSLGSPKYITVKNILDNSMDMVESQKSLPPLPLHKNIRGAAEYM
ncbi:MAG: IS21 family transposase [Desulfobacterales bacterium]|nr:IS21 family transposase [Eubacteriales bacterium]MDD3083275.1 IS21 family transposase [Desulfobacterales bacterium]